ncbi:MAG: LPXTG cell wall anchor domain-containing protein, partial [Actinomycetota bacterium]|nr:LPXTG cell wall anchor domain-containing protein [Actinomycetota bacterium]
PGATWRTPGPEATGGQDVIFTVGENLTVNVNDPAPTTTTPDPDEDVELPATGSNSSPWLAICVLGGGLALVALTRRNREAR